jgi:two-component system, NarL family, invasion response regulator UvrY
MKTALHPDIPFYKIILADDHKLFRQMLAKQIDEFEAFSVVEQADNGLQLINLITNGLIPDIILLDINMPVMDGYDTARWLTKNRPSIKIIVLTIFANEHVKAQVIQCGADAVVSKNIELKDLCDLLKDLVKKNGREHFYPPDLLSDRELQLLKMMCTDLKYQTIAKQMEISYRLVEHTRKRLFQKFNVNNRISMVAHAIKSGIII